ELTSSLDQAAADLSLAADLDRVRQDAATLVEGQGDPRRARAEYPKVLAQHGLDVVEGDLDEVAQSIRASAIRGDIIAALDNWAPAETDPQRRQRLLRLANSADEADPWRQAVREAIAKKDRNRVRQLVRGPGEGKPTPGVVLLLASTFREESEAPTAL